MSTADSVLVWRDRLTTYFRGRAGVEDFDLSPIIRDDRTTILADRAYEEILGDRSFIVCVMNDPGYPYLDPFTKKTGVDYEIDLLQIISPPDEGLFPKIWDLYVKWIHERLSERETIGE